MVKQQKAECVDADHDQYRGFDAGQAAATEEGKFRGEAGNWVASGVYQAKPAGNPHGGQSDDDGWHAGKSNKKAIESSEACTYQYA